VQPEPDGAPPDTICLEREQAHHVSRVLRMTIGDPLELLDGRGFCYLSRIVEIHKDRVILQYEAQRFVPASRLQLSLIQGLCAAELMDFSLQKGVELGLNVFTPAACQRSVSLIDAARSASKQRHWQMVAQAACMQSSNPWLPVIDPPQSLDEALGQACRPYPDEDSESVIDPQRIHRWMLDPYASVSLREKLLEVGPQGATARRRVVLLVGPEAGLSGDEVRGAQEAGFISVHLGPRTLRTETAALAALAAIQSDWGDWDQAASRPWS